MKRWRCALSDSLDADDPLYEHHLTEALWVSWGLNKVDENLVRKLLKAQDFKARTAAVRVLRYTGHQIKDQPKLLLEAAKDEHPRVRLEAIVAASWLNKEDGIAVLNEASTRQLDEWMTHPLETAMAHLNGHSVAEKEEVEEVETTLTGEARDLYIAGKAIYSREGFCATCHQEDGAGLEASGFPPLAGTAWANGSEERLIKLTLKGLMGPIEVLGKTYPGQVPMTQFGGLLNDEEVAAVLTYVRNSFGNEASVIMPGKVKEVRAQVEGKTGFYAPEELLEVHPE